MRHILSLTWRLIAILSLTIVIAQAPSAIEDFTAENTITRDVCIIGGGATGTYAAIRLNDMNKTVVVVERSDHLGGHTETLYVEGGGYVDYGVQGSFNNEVSQNFFKRLGVPWKLLLPGSLNNHYVNFKTGKTVPAPPGILDTAVAALLYRRALQQYNFFKDGAYNLPDPVPEELLRPFGEFVKKHNLEGALNLIYTFAHGVGDLLATPAIYVIQLFGIPHIDIFLQGGYITPRNGMSSLYRKAEGILDQNILYNTTALKATRSDTEIQITVQSTTGPTQLIKAKKLLIAIPPTSSNLKNFDLDPTETSLFNKIFWKTYYVAVIKNAGIPDNLNVMNLDPAETPGNLPREPFQWGVQDMGPANYLASKIVGDANYTEAQAKDLILSDLRRMGAAGTFKIRNPEIKVFGDHTPTTLMVDVDNIRGGYYRRLYGLQGLRGTFYTGYMFCSDYSGLLWGYTEGVVKKMFPGG
ncbi:hypothetical protein BDV29DRAFT_198423 [Aspergillus leporis]|jgi:hypothetical protein|uniref:Amine oxidase domain-containing protein n=1 Tax=Aspergillus leporis TaxID=41062 RepID=A0A5N5XBV7_9EURO|nr:hypothetical protein BDV29DRAFT_198423 [Aspergillus leporis]